MAQLLKVLVVQAWGPEINPEAEAAFTCDLDPTEAEKEHPWGLLANQSSQREKLPGSVRDWGGVFQKISGDWRADSADKAPGAHTEDQV